MKAHPTIEQLAVWGHAQINMSQRLRQHAVKTIWMDSRKIAPGDVFLALSTKSNDGHNYVEEAFQSGAAAAIVDAKKADRFPLRLKSKLLLTKDPLQAVSRMAREYRRELGIPVVAVTGSNGKTTTRHFIAALLNGKMSVGETYSNWNNEIGVPLSILRFSRRDKIAIMELAANHAGEIYELSRISRPDIGVITNIGYAHIGMFRTLTNTTKTKFEITAGMSKRKGMLLLNGDDRRLVRGAQEYGYRTVFFGYSRRCAIRVTDEQVCDDGRMSFTVDNYKYCLRMPGRHFIYSALPAIYLARQHGITQKNIADTLYGLEPDPLRGRIRIKNDVTFIVDCYNANPSSMRSSIALLRSLAKNRVSAAVIGDMKELGTHAKRLHKQLGRELAKAGIQKLITVGEYAQTVAEAASGVRRIETASDNRQALDMARSLFTSGDIVLLKGSRAVKLESVYEEY
ncbi:MAG: UDP-N-acetylmuramoyl-tripeptide--D-alanyl-D-alanine ligase [Chitinivibrionales bacterium]